jgi:hypothetical protein
MVGHGRGELPHHARAEREVGRMCVLVCVAHAYRVPPHKVLGTYVLLTTELTDGWTG